MNHDLILIAVILIALLLYVLSICAAEIGIDRLFEHLARRCGIDPDVEPDPEDAEWP